MRIIQSDNLRIMVDDFFLFQVMPVMQASVAGMEQEKRMTIRTERKTKKREESFLKLPQIYSERGFFNT